MNGGTVPWAEKRPLRRTCDGNGIESGRKATIWVEAKEKLEQYVILSEEAYRPQKAVSLQRKSYVHIWQQRQESFAVFLLIFDK
ncbi:hypothetical protein [Falsibacillus albus]|uniref:Uncharacterized protein n=1 Tax=Falsibacillus albus TaxID=2478915 RepID=A0A3L7JQ35_9BACI|nr:hypothetical protein [Falsibacillus albus]RLQ92385.1 hypothetical protein D9X91_19235 [Falsibacillus albus]